MTGKRFGRLLVESFSETRKRHRNYWRCRCDCGSVAVVEGSKLRSGWTKSCGCLFLEIVKANATTHGFGSAGKHLEYRSWGRMKQRCLNPKVPNYKHYGGRGIKVCSRWMKFENFIADMGMAPTQKHTLERKNVNRNYSPSNCCWATNKVQANNKRSNRRLKHNGQIKNVTQWADLVGLKMQTLWARIFCYGWTVERALTTKLLR